MFGVTSLRAYVDISAVVVQSAVEANKNVKAAFVDQRTLRDLRYYNSLTNHRRQDIARGEVSILCPRE